MYKIFIVTLISTQVTLIDCINTSTVCFGVPGLSCTTQRLSCPSHLVIQIINTSYGYRPGCNDVDGQTDCSNTTCCNEEPGDCFIPFSSEDNQQVAGNCTRVERCELSNFRRYNTTDTVCNGRIVSAYSKIQYDCIQGTSIKSTNTMTSTGTRILSTAPTKQPSTNTITEQLADNTSDIGSIVGGIFGAIFIIVIIIAVVVFLYKRRKKSITPPATIKTMTSQCKNVTSQPHHDVDDSGTNKSNNHAIELGDKQKKQATDKYDHIRDDKLKSQPPKDLDNYNHIGNHNHDVHEDNYNHIGNNLSTSPGQFETDYDHINDVFGTSNDEVDYNHIGNHDNKKVITDENYHHIGSGGMQVRGDYNHIGSEELTFISNDHYNHVV